MFHFVYILFSHKDMGIYIGFTDNLPRRIKEHHQGNVKSTENRRPIDLIYFEGYKNKKDALQREMYLKTGWGRNYLKKIIKNYFLNNSKI
ncbi:GIY-YIG nuclease family protein [Candidatus Wolfebacteria bacterium]|nr:GIY-YIG nuclease family protein [Candidatus Wolfebacteria bacterium]